MASQTQICSATLTKISQGRITSITEGTPAAIILTNVYDITLERCLRSHNWNFAIKRQSLALLTAEPAFEYGYYFQLPSDFIKEVSLYNNTYDYKIEGDRIATSAGEVNLVYIARITDTQKFDPLFTDYFISALSAEVSRAFTGSEDTTQRLIKETSDKLRVARRVDAQQGSSDRRSISGDLVDSYYTQYYSGYDYTPIVF